MNEFVRSEANQRIHWSKCLWAGFFQELLENLSHLATQVMICPKSEFCFHESNLNTTRIRNNFLNICHTECLTWQSHQKQLVLGIAKPGGNANEKCLVINCWVVYSACKLKMYMYVHVYIYILYMYIIS